MKICTGHWPPSHPFTSQQAHRKRSWSQKAEQQKHAWHSSSLQIACGHSSVRLGAYIPSVKPRATKAKYKNHEVAYNRSPHRPRAGLTTICLPQNAEFLRPWRDERPNSNIRLQVDLWRDHAARFTDCQSVSSRTKDQHSPLSHTWSTLKAANNPVRIRWPTIPISTHTQQQAKRVLGEGFQLRVLETSWRMRACL